MQASHLDELIQLEESYWWHIAKRELAVGLLQQYFPPPGLLIEGGIGSARNLLEFQRLGYEVAGLDLMSAAVANAKQRGLENIFEHDLGEPWPFAAESARVVILLDVIEHTEDPVRVLRHAYDTLQPGGGAIVTVPAYPWLFGDWDRSLGHYRRYTYAVLRQHAEAAGFTVDRIAHWNSFTTPAAFFVRGYQRCFPSNRSSEFPRVPDVANRLLLTMAQFERRLLSTVSPPFGLSLVGVLKK